MTHVAGCFFYYLATTIPADNEDHTWIGALTLGDFSYENFRELDLGIRYVTSVYWAIVTMATVGQNTFSFKTPKKPLKNSLKTY